MLHRRPNFGSAYRLLARYYCCCYLCCYYLIRVAAFIWPLLSNSLVLRKCLTCVTLSLLLPFLSSTIRSIGASHLLLTDSTSSNNNAKRWPSSYDDQIDLSLRVKLGLVSRSQICKSYAAFASFGLMDLFLLLCASEAGKICTRSQWQTFQLSTCISKHIHTHRFSLARS